MHTETVEQVAQKKHSVRYDGPNIKGIYIPYGILAVLSSEGVPQKLTLSLDK